MDVPLHGKRHRNSDDAPGLYHNSAKQLRRALADCRITGAELGRRIDVHANTVTAWTSGKRPVPGAVMAYLDLLAKVKALAL